MKGAPMATARYTFKSVPFGRMVVAGADLPDDDPVVKRHPSAFNVAKPHKRAARKKAAAKREE